MSRRFFRVALLAILAFLLVSLALIRHPASEPWQGFHNFRRPWSEQQPVGEDDLLRIPHGASPDLNTIDKQAEALGIDVPSFNSEPQDEKPTETRMNLFRPAETAEAAPEPADSQGKTGTWSTAHGHKTDDDLVDELNRPFSQKSEDASSTATATSISQSSQSTAQAASSTASVFSAHIGFSDDDREKSIAHGLGLFPLAQQHTTLATSTTTAASSESTTTDAPSDNTRPSRTQTTLATETSITESGSETMESPTASMTEAAEGSAEPSPSNGASESSSGGAADADNAPSTSSESESSSATATGSNY